RRAELPALGRSAGDACAGRRRTALRRDRRSAHLHGGARSAGRHESAILVFLARPAADRRHHLSAQWPLGRLRRLAGALAETRVTVQGNNSILATRDLNKNFGSLIVARSIELSLPLGARYALIGPNGAGKTTLINLITGMVRPDGGQILLD